MFCTPPEGHGDLQPPLAFSRPLSPQGTKKRNVNDLKTSECNFENFKLMVRIQVWWRDLGLETLIKFKNEVAAPTIQIEILATGKYRCTEVRVYRAECSEQLGRVPSKIGSSKSLVLKSFSGEGTLWDSSLPVSLTLCGFGIRLHFLRPHFPLPQRWPCKFDQSMIRMKTCLGTN